jgi:hypothetical protein
MKSIKYFGLLLILPLITMALTTNYIIEADAEKGQGVPSSSYGSKNKGIVCGDRLCSEIPDGKDAIKNEKPMPITPTVPAKPTMTSPKSEKMENKSMSSMQDQAELGSVLKLSRANVPATIPLHHGFYNSGDVFYIITDASEQKHADLITEQQKWKVELAPLLANAPKEALSTTYFFTNGVKGDGIHGFQGQVFASTPAQTETYSALTSHVHVTWNQGNTPTVLKSEQEIMDAEKSGKITLSPLSVVINMPQIIWPEGQMMVKEDKTLSDDTPYGGGQITEINKEKMTVTFVAHRGWGPDGKSIYYIVTDATPSDPAEMMGITSALTSASLIANSAAVDLFQFTNGIKGSGPMGFQPGIAAGVPGDANYSPMWRIFVVDWKDPTNAALLQTTDDINFYTNEGKINVNLARPMDSDHIVNCPFIDPFQ